MAALVGAAKRCASGRHLEEHEAEREEIGAGVDVLAAKLLRRHVGDRSDRGAGFGQKRPSLLAPNVRSAVCVIGLCQPEIENLRATFGEKDVRRLDVTMDDAGAMRGVKRIDERDRNVETRGQVEWACAAAVPASVSPCSSSMTMKGVTVGGLADVVDGADVRMLERRDGPRLSLETVACVRRVNRCG